MSIITCFKNLIHGNDYKTGNIGCANALRNSLIETLKFSETRCIYLAYRKQNFTTIEIHERQWIVDK